MIPKIKNGLFYLIGLCAIVFYSIIVYQHAYNIPKWDDFQDVLLFLDRWISADTASAKFGVFISQTNEHILLVNHLIILAQYYLVGHLNFSWLIYIGNIFYIGSALLLWLFFKDHSERATVFAILMLTSITFYPYESNLWAMTAISNQAVIFFSFLAIYFISKPKSNFALAILFSALAVFSQSNGLIVLLVIASYLAITKQKLRLMQWLCYSAIIIGLYAHWFNPASTKDIDVLGIIVALPLINFFMTIPAFIACFGGITFLTPDKISILLSLLIGLLILAITLNQLKQKKYPAPIIAVLAFLLISIASIGFYRGLMGGILVAYVSRYKMYASYFMALAMLLSPLLMDKITKSGKWRFGLLFFSVVFFSSSFYLGLPYATLIDGDLQQSLQRWAEDGDLRRGRGYFVKDADSYLFAALKNKTYTPMNLLPQNKIIKQVTTLPSCPIADGSSAPITDTLTITHKNPNAPAIKVSLTENVIEPITAEPITITLCSSQLSYQFTLNRETPSANESTYYIPRESIAPETYIIFLQRSDATYQLPTPFINKKNKR